MCVKLLCMGTQICVNVVNFQYELFKFIGSFSFRTCFVESLYFCFSFEFCSILFRVLIYCGPRCTTSSLLPTTEVLLFNLIPISFEWAWGKMLNGLGRTSLSNIRIGGACEGTDSQYHWGQVCRRKINVDRVVQSYFASLQTTGRSMIVSLGTYLTGCLELLMQFCQGERYRFTDQPQFRFQWAEFSFYTFFEVLKTWKYCCQIIYRESSGGPTNAGRARHSIRVRKL